jgi:hypothetical protein
LKLSVDVPGPVKRDILQRQGSGQAFRRSGQMLIMNIIDPLSVIENGIEKTVRVFFPFTAFHNGEDDIGAVKDPVTQIRIHAGTVAYDITVFPGKKEKDRRYYIRVHPEF